MAKKTTKSRPDKGRAETPSLSVLATERRDIPAAALVPAAWNKRGDIRPEDVADLVDSIRAVGLIQRIAVMADRLDDAGERFIILAGHRRFEACRLAGLDPVPCEVVSCDGRQAHMITAIENLHRADLSAMQEAEVVEDLLAEGLTAEEVAAQTGRHVRWVYRRASVLNLIQAWRDAAHSEGLCAAFLEELSRLPGETQKAVLDKMHNRWDCKTALTRGGDVAMVKYIISDLTMALGTAPWAKKHPEWCAGCTSCSDAKPDLFDETEIGEGAMCLDKSCWDRRKAALVEEQRAELEAKHGDVRTASDQDYRYGRLSDAKARKDKNHTEPVLITDGDNAGKVLWVASAEDKKAAKERGEPVALASKQPTLSEKRAAWVIRKVRDMVEESKSGANPFERFDCLQIIETLSVTGTQHARAYRRGEEWLNIKDMTVEDMKAKLWRDGVAPVLLSRLNYPTITGCCDYYDEAVLQAEWFFGVTQNQLDAEAAEAIKDKSKKGEKI